MTSTLGYARVSTAGQDLSAQLDALTAAGVAAERMVPLAVLREYAVDVPDDLTEL